MKKEGTAKYLAKRLASEKELRQRKEKVEELQQSINSKDVQLGVLQEQRTRYAASHRFCTHTSLLMRDFGEQQ
jgi:hypothetical protein